MGRSYGRNAARGSDRGLLARFLDLYFQALTRLEKNKVPTVFFGDLADPVVVKLVAIVAKQCVVGWEKRFWLHRRNKIHDVGNFDPRSTCRTG